MDQERKLNIGYIESIRYEKCVTPFLSLHNKMQLIMEMNHRRSCGTFMIQTKCVEKSDDRLIIVIKFNLVIQCS